MTKFTDLMERWYDTEIAKIYSERPPAKPGALMLGCPVWGKTYVDLLTNYCLTTMMSGENYEALKDRSRVVLYVDQANVQELIFAIRGIEGRGVEFMPIPIPDEIIKAISEHPANKYWLLGTAEDLLMQMAGRCGMAFHMLLPDHVFSSRYFPNLFRLSEQHEVITQIGISADVQMCEWLEKQRHPDGGLIIEDRVLGDKAFQHLHKQMRAYLMNGVKVPEEMPHSHFLAWQGRDRMLLSSCHQNAAWLSPKICAAAPRTHPATMDAVLPDIIGNTPFYVPTADDGLTFIELSDETKPHNEGYTSFKEFATRSWGQCRFDDRYLRWTKRLSEIPIEPQPEWMSDEEIAQQHEAIVGSLVDVQGKAAIEFCRRLWKRQP